MAKIQFLDHEGNSIEGSVGKDKTEITIGRGKAADLRVQNPTVSRVHCQVLFASGNFYVEDLGSSNGTYYNMERLKPNEPVPLEDGDVFFAGNLEVRFHFEDADYLALDNRDSPPLPLPDEADATMAADEVMTDDKAGEEVAEDALPEDVVIVDEDVKPVPEHEEEIEEPVVEAQPSKPLEKPDDSPVEFGEVRHTVMEKLETVHEDAQKQITALEDQVMEKDEIISGLQRQVDELREAVSRLQQTEEPDTGVSLEEMQSLLDNAEAENARMEDRIEDLNKRIAGDGKKLKHLAKLEAKADAAKQAGQERDQLAAKVAKQQQQLEDAGKKIAQFEENAKQGIQKEEFDRILKEKDALLEENKRWEDLKKQFEQDLADLKTQRDALQEQIDRLKADAGNSEELAENLHKLQSRIDELTKDLENARLANRSYIKKVSRLLEANEKLKSGAGQADDSVLDELKNQNKGLQSQIAELHARLEQAEGTVSTPREYPQLRESYEDLNELIHQLQTDVDIVAQLSHDRSLSAEARTSKIETQAEQIHDSVTKFKTGLKSLDSLLKKLGI